MKNVEEFFKGHLTSHYGMITFFALKGVAERINNLNLSGGESPSYAEWEEIEFRTMWVKQFLSMLVGNENIKPTTENTQ